MYKPRAQWPDDVDGDVLRRFQQDGFDFSKAVNIDFNIDFKTWPPPAEFMAKLAGQYPGAKLVQPDKDDDGEGYVLIVVHELLSYELVVGVQSELTALAAPYGGKCDSWGACS